MKDEVLRRKPKGGWRDRFPETAPILKRRSFLILYPSPFILPKVRPMPDLPGLQLLLSPDVLVALADDDGDGLADDGVIEEALAAATREVRQAVAGVFSVAGDAPLPALLADIAQTLAVERLYERRREALPGPWTQRAARARVLLHEVARGERPVEGAPRAAPRIASNVSPEDRVFTTGRMGTF